MHLITAMLAACRIRRMHAPSSRLDRPFSAEFVYKNDSVIKVGKEGYFHCYESYETAPYAAPRDGTAFFLLNAPGPAYFASADIDHCYMGQRLMVDVLADRAAAPGPWAAPGPCAHHSAAAPPTYSAARAVALMVPVALALAVGFV